MIYVDLRENGLSQEHPIDCTGAKPETGANGGGGKGQPAGGGQ